MGAQKSVVRLPNCRFIGAVPVAGDFDYWFARIRRPGLKPVALGNCLIAADTTIKPLVSNDSCLTFVQIREAAHAKDAGVVPWRASLDIQMVLRSFVWINGVGVFACSVPGQASRLYISRSF